MRIPLMLKENSYDVILEKGCLARAGELLKLDRKVLIVTDTGVPARYAETVAESCRTPVVVTVKEGEGRKSLQTFEMLLRTMLENHFSRKDCVAAVGGGVVGDLAGFAASATSTVANASAK